VTDGLLRKLSGGNWMVKIAAQYAARLVLVGLSLEKPLPCVLFLPLNRGLMVRIMVFRCGRLYSQLQDSYLVDSASSHMLVSKIKPCMSKYKQFVL
jgi:hypothetical protein